MKLRHATSKDVPRLAGIAVAAFAEEPFYEYMFPRRKEFPDDYATWWYRRIRDLLVTPNVAVIVAEDKNTGPSPSKTVPPVAQVVGFAVWQLWAKDPVEAPHPKGLYFLDKDSSTERIKRWAYCVEKRMSSYLHPDKAGDASRWAEFRQMVQEKAEEFYSKQYKVHWHLTYCAIAPEWQRKGVERMLLDWGINQAEKDELPTSVEQGIAPIDFFTKRDYERRGDTRLGTMVLPVLVRPAGGKSAMCMEFVQR